MFPKKLRPVLLQSTFNQTNENLFSSIGRPDRFIAPADNTLGSPDPNSFKERTFTANDVPSFRYYRIKLVMTSTNQVYVPRVKDLKVLALA